MPSAPANLKLIAAILSHRYRDFAHYNITNDPLEELLFIICSTKTTEATYRAVYASLRSAFPNNEALLVATADDLEHAMRAGGLARKKAAAIKVIMMRTHQQFGRLTLDSLRHLTDQDCECFLTSLPGVGKKVARCVMLYSLDRRVFPVDEHCWRISKRLGMDSANEKKSKRVTA